MVEGNKGSRNIITIKYIADKLGVSITTVSRVLNGKAKEYRISERTANAILELAKELNYTPNPIAKSLRERRTNTIGLVIPDISNPFFASIAQNIENEARKFGYTIMLCDSGEDTNQEAELIKILINRRVDGFIICPVGISSEHLGVIFKKKIPIVIVDRYFRGLNCSYVVSDNYRGAYDAVNYLIKCGHRVIGCVQGLIGTSVNSDRVQGYKDALIHNGIEVDRTLITGDSFGEKNGYIATKLLLNRERKPTAILALSNLISLGALKAIKEEGLSIPQDISIISFDDQPYCEYLSPPMTMIAQQKAEMGEIAVKLLINQIGSKENSYDKGNTVQKIVIPTRLVIRKSVSIIS